MSGPLSHIKVLDLSRVLAGPWASQNLADMGADVIKIERPVKGDDSRAFGPPWLKDADGKETSEAAYFCAANRGKRSLTADISKPEAQELIRKLAAKCDVFVENFKYGDLARYGLGYEDIKAINPGIVYCSITGFGQTGPWKERPGYDFMAQGMSGLMSITGSPESETDRYGAFSRAGESVYDRPFLFGSRRTGPDLGGRRHRVRGGGTVVRRRAWPRHHRRHLRRRARHGRHRPRWPALDGHAWAGRIRGMALAQPRRA